MNTKESSNKAWCYNCDWRDENSATARERARQHSKSKKHQVAVESKQLYTYDDGVVD